MRIWLELPYPAVGHWAVEYFGEGAFLVSLAAVPQNVPSLLLKRLIDVAVAAVGLLLCGIVYIFYGGQWGRESGDSPIFCQKRIRNHHAKCLSALRFLLILLA